MNEQNNRAIDRHWCRQWVAEQVFRLRPRDYCLKHPKWPGMVGIEVEMQCYWQSSLDADDPQWVPLFGEKSLAQALLGLQAQKPEWRFETLPQDPHLLLAIHLEKGDQITFEPGGQLEISSKPYPCLVDAIRRVHQVTSFLREYLRGHQIALMQIGANPWFDTERLELQMTKPRYRAMNEFFNSVGPYGRQMMRLTCTIQVNLDFGEDDPTLAKRYLVANLLAPVATAIFAYSAFSSGQPNGFKSYRSRIWQGLDDTRTGFPNLGRIVKDLNKDACVDVYMDRLMACRVVFIEALNFKTDTNGLTFGEWLENGFDGVYPTEKDFLTHMSLFFPEVRARGFMELRSVDVQSPVWQVVPACFFTALLYDEENLDRLLKILPHDNQSIDRLWRQSSYGLADDELRNISLQVMDLAQTGFNRLPSCYQGDHAGQVFTAFTERFTKKGRSPADDLLDAHRESGNDRLTPKTVYELEAAWAKDIDKTQ
ncbi:MAG: glutamate-cysteine ligase family protein [Oligoflexus sp.]